MPASVSAAAGGIYFASDCDQRHKAQDRRKDGEYGIKLYYESCPSLTALLKDWAVPYSQNA